jgi:hypothetical protein
VDEDVGTRGREGPASAIEGTGRVAEGVGGRGREGPASAIEGTGRVAEGVGSRGRDGPASAIEGTGRVAEGMGSRGRDGPASAIEGTGRVTVGGWAPATDGDGVRTVDEGSPEGFGSRGRVAERSGSRGPCFTGVVPERFKMAEGLFMADCSFKMAGDSFVKMAEGSFKMADGFFMVAGLTFEVADGSFNVAVCFPIVFRRPVGFFVSYSFNIFSNPVQKMSKVFSFFARNQLSAKCQRNRVVLNSF